MPKKPLVSINQIIFFVVFISAALITSLFIFHLRHQSPNILSSDKGMVFTAPRDIKSFELITASNTKFTEQNLQHHWTLLFFGFTHCSNVCPTTLDVMKRAYVNLHKQYPNLQVVLISVDPERDTPASLAAYTQTYNPDFIGVTGKLSELRKLQSQLGVFAARDEKSGTNYQVQHTASIMLINPQGKWAGLFKFGLSPAELEKSVTQSVQALS